MIQSTFQQKKQDRRGFDSYRRLACSVLTQALLQAAGRVPDSMLSNAGGHDKRGQIRAIVAQAKVFLQSDDARLWLEMAGDDFDFEVLQGLVGDLSCIPVEPLGRHPDPPSHAKHHPEWAKPLAVPPGYREVLR